MSRLRRPSSASVGASPLDRARWAGTGLDPSAAGHPPVPPSIRLALRLLPPALRPGIPAPTLPGTGLAMRPDQRRREDLGVPFRPRGALRTVDGGCRRRRSVRGPGRHHVVTEADQYLINKRTLPCTRIEAPEIRRALRLYEKYGRVLPVAKELGVSPPKVSRVLRANGVRVRPRTGRPPITEVEWARRRKIASASRSWPEYAKRAGLLQVKNPAEHRLHGVRLGCWFRCGRIGETTTGIVGTGSGQRPVCRPCLAERLHRKPKEAAQ